MSKAPYQKSQVVNADGTASTPWYKWFATLGNSGSKIAPLAPSGSPYVFQAPSNGTFLISSGSVSSVSYSRDGTTYYATQQTAGMFPMFTGDFIKVAYSGSVAMEFIPQ